MSARANLRETEHALPVAGMHASKSSVIAVKFGNQDRDDDVPVISESQLAAGYRSLMRDETLAGRQASRNFRKGEGEVINSRLRMVKSLRQKESWLIWRDVVRDFERTCGAVLQRLSPSFWLRDNKTEESVSEYR